MLKLDDWGYDPYLEEIFFIDNRFDEEFRRNLGNGNDPVHGSRILALRFLLADVRRNRR